MQEYPIHSLDSGEVTQNPLDCEHVYAMPYVEGNEPIQHAPGTDDESIIGGGFLKQRIIVEHPLPSIGICLTRGQFKKLDARFGENNGRIERFMALQEILLQIREQIIEAMRRVYSPDVTCDSPDADHEAQIARLHAEIKSLDIPGILTRNGIDVSQAKGELEFAFAGFQLGFSGRAVYNMVAVEDEDGNFFLTHEKF